MKKRILALLAAAIMLQSLTACGGSDTSSTAGTASGGSAGNASQQDGAHSLRTSKFDGVTLKRVLWYTPGEEEKKMVADFEAQYGCKIQDEVVDFTNITTKLATSIASADPIDIGFIYGAMYPSVIIKNMFEPIDDYIDNAYMVDQNNLSAGGFDITKMQHYMWKGHYYGFSSYYDVDMMVMYYNKKMFQDAGETDPMALVKQGKWNLDTFYEAAKNLTDPGKVYGIAAESGSIFIRAFGGNIVKYDTNGAPSENLGDQKVIDALKFYQKMTSGEGAVMATEEGLFEKGKAAMMIHGTYQAPKIANGENVPDSVKNNWAICPIPLAASNTDGGYPVDWLKATAITKGSKNKDAVAAFALFKSKFKGDNLYDEYFSDDQKAMIEPLYKNINFANYGYGEITTLTGQMMAQIANGSDITQVLGENKPKFAAEINKTLNN